MYLDMTVRAVVIVACAPQEELAHRHFLTRHHLSSHIHIISCSHTQDKRTTVLDVSHALGSQSQKCHSESVSLCVVQVGLTWDSRQASSLHLPLRNLRHTATWTHEQKTGGGGEDPAHGHAGSTNISI